MACGRREAIPSGAAGGTSTVSTVLGNRAKTKGARFPHFHSDGSRSRSGHGAPSGRAKGFVLAKGNTKPQQKKPAERKKDLTGITFSEMHYP
jgi:hypothetical protein